MNATAIAESVSAVTLVVGVVFAVVQLRQNSKQQRREAAIELVHSFKTREFSETLFHISQLPKGISDAELRGRLEEKLPVLTALAATWEAFGILVYRGDIDIDIFEDFFSGPILYSWDVLRDFVEKMRERTGRDTYFEWFQWLAERVAERESVTAPVPAHIQHRDWRPPKRR